MSTKKSTQLGLADISRLLFIAGVIIAIAIVARAILVPLVFAIILSLVALPVVKKLEGWEIPRIVSVITVVFVGTLLGLGFAGFMTYEMQSFITDIPNLKTYFSNAADSLMQQLRELLNITPQEQEEIIEKNSEKIMAPAGQVFKTALSTTYEALFTITLIPIYMVFLMFYRDKWKHFLISSFEQYTKTEKVESAISEVMTVSRQYIKGVLIVVGILAVLNSIGLLLLGIKYAIIIGIFSATMNIIPYLGNVVGCAIPVAIALATKDSMWYPIGVVAMYITIQVIEGNLITPNVVGSQVNVNPFIAVIALFIGGLIWGIAGIILAIPITAILRVIFTHSKTFKPLGILLSEERGKHK